MPTEMIIWTLMRLRVNNLFPFTAGAMSAVENNEYGLMDVDKAESKQPVHSKFFHTFQSFYFSLQEDMDIVDTNRDNHMELMMPGMKNVRTYFLLTFSSQFFFTTGRH
jgi:hypothetical protein